MPGGDGTGPLGQGSMTGRGFRRCGNRGVGSGNGRGYGADAGWVLGAGVIAPIVAAVLVEIDKQRKETATE